MIAGGKGMESFTAGRIPGIDDPDIEHLLQTSCNHDILRGGMAVGETFWMVQPCRNEFLQRRLT